MCVPLTLNMKIWGFLLFFFLRGEKLECLAKLFFPKLMKLGVLVLLCFRMAMYSATCNLHC